MYLIVSITRKLDNYSGTAVGIECNLPVLGKTCGSYQEKRGKDKGWFHVKSSFPAVKCGNSNISKHCDPIVSPQKQTVIRKNPGICDLIRGNKYQYRP